MAAPHVAGLAALIWSLDPTLSPDMVRVLMESSAVDKGAPGPDPYYGHGRIDAYAAVHKTDRLLAPTDPRINEQWALAIADVPEAWAYEDTLAITATAPVTVAILSSGVVTDHPELAGRLLPGYDFVADDAVPEDTIGSGTALAGVVAAGTDNGLGIAGMARSDDVRILPVRVTYTDTGALIPDALADGIAYAADQGAQVLLIGGTLPSSDAAVEAALEAAADQGALIVAGTGDTEASTVGYPASSEHVMAVSSTTWEDELAWDANHGPGVAMAAPGGGSEWNPSGVLTLDLGDGYKTRASTAVAAAHVAGAAAMILTHAPAARPAMQLDVRRLRMLLQAPAQDLGAAGPDTLYGSGRLDLDRSLRLAMQVEPQLYLATIARND
jgi:subtilisin family serine protease